ncbi:MAG: phosphonoacetaldehyde reductase [Methanobacteriota archaeon]|nr:MAG: phosphonoacetaldehyde reductase [Euryarchaeota archaeon]
MSSWSFYNPTRIIFGENVLDSIGSIVDGERMAVVTTPGFRKRGMVDRIEGMMNDRIKIVLDVVSSYPSLESIDALRGVDGLDALDAIVALGGGSSIDMGKALSRLASSARDEHPSGNLWDIVNQDGIADIPVIAVPTTAGTGSEVTPTATVWDYQNRIKRSLSGDDLFPKVAIVDPVLTHDLPVSLTVSSGLDAISHALESIWNRNASPISLAVATQSLRFSLHALPRLKADCSDYEARTHMMQASLMAGMAISQTRTALSHSLSYPLTMEFGIPHGVACSFALPEILGFNLMSDDGRLERLATEIGFESVDGLEYRLRELLESSLSPLEPFSSLSCNDLTEDLVNRMYAKGRLENNLRDVDSGDLIQILRDALDRYGVR